MDTGEKLSRSVDISARITKVLHDRTQVATERFRARTQKGLLATLRKRSEVKLVGELLTEADKFFENVEVA